MYFEHYLNELGYSNIPEFLIKYLETPSLLRLKKVGYFCGMDYASKNIYNFFYTSKRTCCIFYKFY